VVEGVGQAKAPAPPTNGHAAAVTPETPNAAAAAAGTRS
jgi:hypothetical protein